MKGKMHDVQPASTLESLLTHALPATEVGALPRIVLGRIVGVDAGGIRLVLPALHDAELTALALCPVGEGEVGQTCAVQFIDGDAAKPLIMGLLYAPETTALGALLSPQEREPLKVRHGEKQVIIEAEQELVLQCGQACIVLRADGVVHIRGLYIDSQARATHRIRAGSVRVN